ncbi:MAG TPA: aminoglycoside phosphotransferase family protein [Bryobacteraceae bacterium]|nr:aminoglycoside phosphotransferase family protein [Bryobacteraceae bacterium]
MPFNIPSGLASSCRNTPERTAWLNRLPGTLRKLERRWSLTIGSPFEGASCAWVAPVALRHRVSAVLKIGMPQMEGEHEIEGLRFWNADPTVRLLEADDRLGAMLLERCKPGTPLRALPEPEQDVVIASLLRRLWRLPPVPHPFRHLSAMLAHWSRKTLVDIECWPDKGLVREGLQLFEDLPRTASSDVLLATDLHAANVLRSQREPWLVIDPKPFVGDPAYDATQHLFNCRARLRSDPNGTIHRISDLLAVDSERVRLWMFARLAAEPRPEWENGSLALARVLAR